MKSDNWPVRIQKILTPIALYLVAAIVVETIGMFMATLAVETRYGASVLNDYEKFYGYLETYINRWSLPMTGIVACICLPVLIVMYRKDQKRLVIHQPEASAFQYVWITILGMCSCLLLNGLLSISKLGDLLGETYQEVSQNIYSSPLWMQYLVVAGIVPCMEELLFRGLIFRRMRTYAIFSLAALISAILFGIYHMNLLQFIYATCLGLLLAYVYEQFKTIMAPILLHAAANAFSVLISTNASVAELCWGTDQRLVISILIALAGTVCGICLMSDSSFWTLGKR